AEAGTAAVTNTAQTIAFSIDCDDRRIARAPVTILQLFRAVLNAPISAHPRRIPGKRHPKAVFATTADLSGFAIVKWKDKCFDLDSAVKRSWEERNDQPKMDCPALARGCCRHDGDAGWQLRRRRAGDDLGRLLSGLCGAWPGVRTRERAPSGHDA